MRWAVREFARELSDSIFLSTLPYLSEEYPIKGLLVIGSFNPGMSLINLALALFLGPGLPGIIECLGRPGCIGTSVSCPLRLPALGNLLVRREVTLIMSKLSGSIVGTGGGGSK